MRPKAVLALADGSLFAGRAIGAIGKTVGEVVFNTAMTGYQEILTDPSYQQQIVTLTYPHIGNTGTNGADIESDCVQAAGLIIREVPRAPSNWRSHDSLIGYLEANGVVGIGDIDTRRLTRLLRAKGAQNGAIVAGDDIDTERAIAAARGFAGLKGADLAAGAGTRRAYAWTQGAWIGPNTGQDSADRQAKQGFKGSGKACHVAVYDYGVKYNILRRLVDCGARVTVVAPKTPVADVVDRGVDGVLLSNGPGDPEPCDYAIATCRELIERRIPTFGICLGHQLLGLAAGGKGFKMKLGHHGANHPVLDVASGRVMITSQNHGFAIDEASLPAGVRVTHRSLFDGTLQAMQWVDAPVLSFQGHPEASPGPHDVSALFGRFMDLMRDSGKTGLGTRDSEESGLGTPDSGLGNREARDSGLAEK